MNVDVFVDGLHMVGFPDSNSISLSCRLTELPYSIGFLYRLDKIDLSQNKLKKLPLSLGSLPSLSYVDISGNSEMEPELLSFTPVGLAR